MGKLSSVVGKTLDNTRQSAPLRGNRSISEGDVTLSHLLLTTVMEVSPPPRSSGSSPWIQHEGGEWPGNEKSHQFRSCLKSGFVGENNEF